MAPIDVPLGMVAVADLCGLVRGKSFGPHRRAAVLEHGLAWVPANIAISPFGTLPPDNPFGPMGEIVLRAAPETRIDLPGDADTPPMELWLADILDPGGAHWGACPRNALRSAVADLRAETGLTLKVALEHEFTLVGEPYGRDPSFSLAAIRRAGRLAVEIDRLLAACGMPAEQIVPEYGAGQYEIAATPQDPMRACDEAILSREIIRDAARRAGIHASFVPKPAPDAAGNGVHLHLSLWQGDRPALAENGWLSAPGGAFASGILAHAGALLLFTLGSVNSALRLQPHSWVGAYACAGTRNREAMLRLCPRSLSLEGPLPGASLEFRTLDATANVHLALAAIIRAGLDGLRRGLPPPADVQGDPDALSPHERAGRGILRLPDGLDAILAAATADRGLLGTFPPLLVDALLSVRRDEARLHSGADPADLARRLAAIY